METNLRVGLDDGKTTSAMGLLGVGPEEVMGLGAFVASRRLVAVGLGRDGGGAGGHCQSLFLWSLWTRAFPDETMRREGEI